MRQHPWAPLFCHLPEEGTAATGPTCAVRRTAFLGISSAATLSPSLGTVGHETLAGQRSGAVGSSPGEAKEAPEIACLSQSTADNFSERPTFPPLLVALGEMSLEY